MNPIIETILKYTNPQLYSLAIIRRVQGAEHRNTFMNTVALQNIIRVGSIDTIVWDLVYQIIEIDPELKRYTVLSLLLKPGESRQVYHYASDSKEELASVIKSLITSEKLENLPYDDPMRILHGQKQWIIKNCYPTTPKIPLIPVSSFEWYTSTDSNTGKELNIIDRKRKRQEDESSS